MNMLPICSVLLLLLLMVPKRQASVNLLFDETLHSYIEDSAECLLRMAKKYFAYGSVTSLISSGLHGEINPTSAKASFPTIIDKFMGSFRWNILVAQLVQLQIQVNFLTPIVNSFIWLLLMVFSVCK